MTGKQGLWIGCGVLALVVVVCGGLVGGIGFWLSFTTRGPAKAADNFLALLKEGQIHEAYVSTASGYQMQQDEKTFAADVQKRGLTDYASSSWPNRQVHNHEGSVEGNITTKQGTTIP